MAMIHIQVSVLVLLAFEQVAVTGQDMTCGALKTLYKNSSCCGNPNAVVPGFASDGSTRGGSSDQCEDLSNWKDSDGDSCSSIVKKGYCSDGNKYKTAYGSLNIKVSAKESCCGCGGGMRTQLGKMQKCIDYTDSKLKGKRGYMSIVKNGHCYEKTDTRGKQFRKSVKKGKMMFFGDSDVEFWKSEQTFPDAINCGVGGSTAYDAGMYAAKTASKFEPKGYVVMVAGENDMGNAIECAETIFATLKTAVDAFVNSKYHPTVIMFSTKPEPGTTNLHSLYEQYDVLCKELAETPEMKGHFKFVHAYQKFKDLGNPGNLYQSDDLHMSNKGYALWNTWLQETVKEGCHDIQSGTAAWADSDGDTCASISAQGWCDAYAEYTVDGVGANSACCECGGGCDDIAGWKDSDGDDCSKITTKDSEGQDMCQHADDYKVNGVGAKEACCKCGGGVKRQALTP